MPLHLAPLIFCHRRLFVEEKVDDFVLRPKVSAPLATIPSKAAVLQIVIQTAFFLLGKTDRFFPHQEVSSRSSSAKHGWRFHEVRDPWSVFDDGFDDFELTV